MNDKKYYIYLDELPIWNWHKIANTGNLIYLHKDNDYSKTDYSLVEIWDKLQDEYLEEFGITNEFRAMLVLKKRWINIKSNFLLTGDRFLLNELDEIEIDLKDTSESKVISDKDDTLIMMEQQMGFPIDEKKMSVKKYYKTINYLSRQK